MNIHLDEQTLSEIQNYHLPRYPNIPDVGLYLKQTTKYLNDVLYPLLHTTLTETMVSNYVKMHLVANPVKKLYYREQIAHLLFIVMSKTVLTLDDVALMLRMQLATHSTGASYEYFCREFENALAACFGLERPFPELNQEGGDEKKILRMMIGTIAQRICLERCFRALEAGQLEEAERGRP